MIFWGRRYQFHLWASRILQESGNFTHKWRLAPYLFVTSLSLGSVKNLSRQIVFCIIFYMLSSCGHWSNKYNISSSSLGEALVVANKSKSLPNMWSKLELKHQIFASAVTFQRGSFILQISSKYLAAVESKKKTNKENISDEDIFRRKYVFQKCPYSEH